MKDEKNPHGDPFIDMVQVFINHENPEDRLWGLVTAIIMLGIFFLFGLACWKIQQWALGL